MTEIIFGRHSGKRMLSMLDKIADLYREIHSEIPGESDGLFSRPSFVSRTSGQAQEPGFELVTATADDIIVGFSFGYPFFPGKWWGGCTLPSQEILNSSKFAVIELDVRKTYRGQGLAKRLLEPLLANRTEDFATLAATPGSLAYAMYIRWGWYKVGVFEEAPVMDAMLIPLNGESLING